jgi:hypothetical protein
LTDQIRTEILKRLQYMENSWSDSRVLKLPITEREAKLALLTIARARLHVEQAFKGQVLEGEPIE